MFRAAYKTNKHFRSRDNLVLTVCCLISILSAFVVRAQNTCSTQKLFVQSSPVNRVIFQFQCTAGTLYNPTIPVDSQGSSPIEYNELDLSPNLYTSVPVTQICQFVNLYTVDLSYNLITSMTNVFAQLSCLTQLTHLDLGHNQIVTPLVATDFADSQASRLLWLNLEYNNISSIDAGMFYYANGSARFPKLAYLSLSRNRLFSIDLLWPMTMTNANLKIDLSNNSIATLTNSLNLNFGLTTFIPMTGNRQVDLKNNLIVSLTDSNLLQYGLTSADDFRNFLFKISNYDLRGTQFTCLCPIETGLYTVYWYSQFASSPLNPSALIYQLYCSNVQNAYIFNFPCQFVGTTRGPTTTTTTQSTTASSLASVTTTTVIVNSAGQQVGDSNSTSPSTVSQSNSNSKLGLLALLIIPVLLILLFLFACVCGRWCLSYLYDSCAVSICTCFRPDVGSSKKTFKSKPYEAVVCYNEFDETWVNERFWPFFKEICFGNELKDAKKVNKLARLTRIGVGSGAAESATLSQHDVDLLRSAKRIVVILTKKFLNEEWTNKAFKDTLLEINRIDAYCSIILVNLSEVDEYNIEKLAREIEINETGWLARVRNRLANRVKYNCGIKDVEWLDWNDSSFWSDLKYLMPRNRVSPVTSSAKKKRPQKVVRGITDSPEPIVDQTDQESRRGSTGSGELPLVTRLKRLNDPKRVTPVNNIRSNELILDMNPQEDMNFWNSLVIAKSDFSYEPVGLAGSAVSGNRTANLNRFGVPINSVPPLSSSAAKPPSLSEESVKTVTSKSSRLERTSAEPTSTTFSSAGTTGSRPSRRVFSKGSSESDLEPASNRVLVPPEFIRGRSADREVTTREVVEERASRRRSSDDSIHQVYSKPPKYKQQRNKNTTTTTTTTKTNANEEADDIYEDIMQVFEENEIRKPKKKMVTNPAPSSTSPVPKTRRKLNPGDDSNSTTTTMAKPKKKVMISSDIERFDMSSVDDRDDDDNDNDNSQQRDLFKELDDFMAESSWKKKSTKTTTTTSGGKNKKNDGKKSPETKTRKSNEKNNYDLYDFEID